MWAHLLILGLGAMRSRPGWCSLTLSSALRLLLICGTREGERAAALEAWVGAGGGGGEEGEQQAKKRCEGRGMANRLFSPHGPGRTGLVSRDPPSLAEPTRSPWSAFLVSPRKTVS